METKFNLAANRKKPMIRFSIRTLLIVTAIVSVAVALPIRAAVKQRQGRQWVAAQNGHVWFEYRRGRESKGEGSKPELGVPDFLVSVFGIDAFNTVTGVMFDCNELDD
jgi:hypothetical protein